MTAREVRPGGLWLAAAGAAAVIAGLAEGPLEAARGGVSRSPATIAEAFGERGLVDVTGRVWTTADVEGRTVLLDAWATWCPPCLAELPHLRALTERYEGRLLVIGLSLDTMPRRDFLSWTRRHDMRWPQVFDGRGYGGPDAARLGIDVLPMSWLFDARGRLAASNLRGAALDGAVRTLMAQEDAAR